MKQPCRECKERTPTCHGTCELYIEWFKENEKIKKKKKSIEGKHRDYFYHK